MRAIPAIVVSLFVAAAAVADGLPSQAEISAHIQAQEWTQAQSKLEKVVAAQPENAQAVFFLAYATHMNGDIEAALPLHKRAAKFDAFRPVATYNIACAHALLGQDDKAIKALDQAVAAGFNSLEQIEGDPDFKKLHDKPGFKAVLAKIRKKNAPVGNAIDLAKLDAERQFDFYAGDWTVRANGTEFDVEVEQILNGRVLQINGPNFASLITYVPTLKTWKWTWVSNAGHHDVLVGGREGDKLVLIQKVLRDRPNHIGRTIFSKISEGSFELDWAVSADEGKTWQREYHARYERKAKSGSAAY